MICLAALFLIHCPYFTRACLMATNPIPNTAMLSIRLDADALAALDSFAVGRGGRSAVVRQMIEQSVQEIADRPHIDRPDGAARNRVSLRLDRKSTRLNSSH